VAYTLVGGTIEYNSIDTVDGATQLTMDTNVGTGGIANDTYISMISPSEYMAANAINHSGTLTLPEAMEYATGGVFNVLSYGASPDASASANVTAIQAAIDAASALTPPGRVVIPEGSYDFDAPITIDTTGVALVGLGGGNSVWLRATDTAASVVVTATGAAIFRVHIEDIAIVAGTATPAVALDLNNANECIFNRVVISTATTGIRMTGSTYSGLCNFSQCKVSNCTTGIDCQGIPYQSFVQGNLYNNTTVIAFTNTTADFHFIDTWVETFTTFALMDSTSVDTIVYGLRLVGCYLLSTSGGVGLDCRIIKQIARNNTYKAYVDGFLMSGCTILTTAAKYVIEIDWDTYTAGGGNHFRGALRDNLLRSAVATMTAWIGSDVTTTNAYNYVDIRMEGNRSSTALATTLPVPLTDATGRVGGTQNLSHPSSLNDTTPSVSTKAPLYVTNNTSATAISNFDDGIDGQVVRVRVNDVYTTFDFTSSYLRGNNEIDWTPAVNDWLEAVKSDGYWYCTVHTSNGVASNLTDSPGAIVSGKCTAVEKGSGVTHQTVLTFTLTGDNDLDLADGDHGTGVKVYDFPAGRILVLGATVNASAVTNDAFEANPNDTYYLGVGTVTAADDATLATTEQDIIPVTTIDTISNTTLTNDWHAALAASAQFDGTSSAVGLYVNAAVAGASLTKALTIAITGTLTVTWINLGDY
jgi:hypothetical protein